MSITIRGNVYYLRFRLFGQSLSVRTSATRKKDAQAIERDLLVAIRIGDCSWVDPAVRETIIRLYDNRQWEYPHGLILADDKRKSVKPEPLLTLWRAIELTFNHPGIKGTPKTHRYKDFAFHLVKKMGKNIPMANIWAREILQYQVERQNDGASNSTINKEVYFLSKVYGVLTELKLVHENPCKLVKSLSERSGQIEAYIGYDDYCRMDREAPHFFQPILATLYMTGMRRNEVLNLRRSDLHMDKRLILLGSQATKEAKRKRVPIHRELLTYVQQALSVQSLRDDHVFLRDGKFVTPDQVRKAWTKITSGMVPRPRLHDLRHTFKTNCRRSGIDLEIRESILGHALKVKDVSSRYGRISNEEFVRAIDQLTFEHGETEIVREDAAYKTKCAQNVYKTQVG